MTEQYDIAIIGGGINGAGIARDAAGRGLKVILLEKGDLGGATSSASSKLIHGGLRYLEYYEFRLVREALKERKVLLGIAPHLVRPMDFILPLSTHTRPSWMIRLGLFLYDFLAPRSSFRGGVKRSGKVTLWGEVLKDEYFHAFRYSDCAVDDARLVLANAQDAAARGADIRTQTAVTALERQEHGWRVTLETAEILHAKAIVNAAGPWVGNVAALAGIETKGRARLIKGSHIVVPRIHHGNHAYLLQLPDNRILFILPFHDAFSLIGTTDAAFDGDSSGVTISDAETDYLLEAVNGYLAQPLSRSDILWSFAGVRSLYDDAKQNASAVTRDYVLELDTENDAPFLTLFGGKITTYRMLALSAMEKLLPHFPDASREAWTHREPLPESKAEEGGAQIATEVTEARLRHACDHEWARTADDFLWRRTKLGLTLPQAEQAKIAAWFDKNRR